MLRLLTFCTTTVVVTLINSSLLFADSEPAYKKHPPLNANQGYLLVDLDVGGVAPSIHVLRTSGSGIETTIQLKDREKGFLLMPMKKGKYQITRVNAPYYDLPFWIDTKFEKDWAFTIEEKKINYIGKLIIGKNRGARSINVNLLNRIATDLDKIEKEYTDLIQLNPLVTNNRTRDDFFKHYYQQDAQ